MTLWPFLFVFYVFYCILIVIFYSSLHFSVKLAPNVEARVIHLCYKKLQWSVKKEYSRIILMGSRNTNIISNKNMAVFLASSLYPLKTAYNLQENNLYFVRKQLSFIKFQTKYDLNHKHMIPWKEFDCFFVFF